MAAQLCAGSNFAMGAPNGRIFASRAIRISKKRTLDDADSGNLPNTEQISCACASLAGTAQKAVFPAGQTADRSRDSELHAELEEARQLGRVEPAEQAEQEIDTLTRELSGAVRLVDASVGRGRTFSLSAFVEIIEN
jgi:hypothetical protein